MKTKITLLLAAQLSISQVALGETQIKVDRVAASSSNVTTIVVKPTKAMRAKCAVYDRLRNPLRVVTRTVSPPLDEVTIITGEFTKEVRHAKCWEE